MVKLYVVIFCVGLGLLGCGSKKETGKPYKESHIVSVIPDYVIEVNEKPKLTSEQINNMSEDALKARLSELQNQTLALTPGQRKELDMIAGRLKNLPSANE